MTLWKGLAIMFVFIGTQWSKKLYVDALQTMHLFTPVPSIPDQSPWWDVPSAAAGWGVPPRTHQKRFCTGTHWKSMPILFSFFTLFPLPLRMTELRDFQPKTPCCWHECHDIPKQEHADWGNSRHRSQLLWKRLTNIFRWVQFLTPACRENFCITRSLPNLTLYLLCI